METNEELFEIVKNTKYKDERREAIGKITDEEMLVNIALNSKNVSTKKFAIENENLKNEKMLLQIALNDNSDIILYACIKKITKGEHLIKIMRKIRPYHFSFEGSIMPCLEKFDYSKKDLVKELFHLNITADEFGYILSKIDDYDYFDKEIGIKLEKLVSKFTIDDITNEKWLHIIACYYPDELVKKNVLRNPNLKNEELVMDVMKHIQNHNYTGLRYDLCKKITNVDYLIEIAKNDPAKEIRKYAEEKILDSTRDSKIIRDIHKNNPQARLNRIKKIDDEEKLVEIAKNDTHINVRKAAIDKIDDEEILQEIGENDEDWCVSQEAFSSFDEKRLIKIFEDRNQALNIRILALKNIKSQGYLFKVASRYNSQDGIEKDTCRYNATKLIRDEKRLLEIAMENTGYYALNAIRSPYLKNNAYLIKIIKKFNTGSFHDEIVVNTAIRKLTDKNRLKSLSKNKSLMENHGNEIRRRLSELEMN
ncbi:MAG: HEAT repeat domain-containing protein [Methanobrevibacter sp.]|nr:HEAT repeat domain-containing protein [Methanobrevibacter sp.]